MFGYIRKLWQALTGWMFEGKDQLNENKHVVKAVYEKSKVQQAERIRTITDAVSKLIGIKNSKKDELNKLTKEMDDLKLAMQGAMNCANQRVAQLKTQGTTKEDIQLDSEYIRCRAGYQDAESTFAAKEERFKTLESSIDENSKTIAEYQQELHILKGQLEQLAEEEVEHIADIERSKAIAAANETLVGISRNSVDQDLTDIRNKRKELQGRAEAAEQLAGTDSKRATDMFIKFAKNEEAASKFDSLMEWNEEEKQPEREASQLPENFH